MSQTTRQIEKKRILLIAFHFPPCSVSSGIQRTLSLTKYLNKYGWEPIVLTVKPSAYEQMNSSQLSSIPQHITIKRSLALDTTKYLSIRGRYWSRLAIPDRWNSWWLSAVPTGMSIIKKHKIKVIWSTYPIATAHNIAATLARLSGLPWIADFRDPMVELVSRTNEIYPKDPAIRKARLAVESKAARFAARLTFCTDSARQIVAERYNLSKNRLLVIPNGYDEDSFLEATRHSFTEQKKSHRKVLLHSGTIYLGTDRDPTPLLKAIKALLDQEIIHAKNFELRLRNSSAENHLSKTIITLGIQSIVTLLPPIPYREALQEMLHVDGLLVLQGFTSNPAIPAKLYEYLRAQRPIIGLVDPEGETAKTLNQLGVRSCNIVDIESIKELLTLWLNGNAKDLETNIENIKKYSRENLTAHLARALDQL